MRTVPNFTMGRWSFRSKSNGKTCIDDVTVVVLKNVPERITLGIWLG
jgi:hypothetical protein